MFSPSSLPPRGGGSAGAVIIAPLMQLCLTITCTARDLAVGDEDNIGTVLGDQDINMNAAHDQLKELLEPVTIAL